MALIVNGVYRPSRLVTTPAPSVVMVLLNKLARGEVSEGLTWLSSVIDVFPCAKHLVGLARVEVAVSDFVELLSVGSSTG
jgi:hypothetical protein